MQLIFLKRRFKCVKIPKRGEMVKGIIVKGLGGLYDVKCSGGDTISCKAKGAFRHEKIKPTIGDFVNLSADPSGNTVIESIEPRRSLLIRPPVANLDILFVVIPARDPQPDLLTADKLISIAEYNHIEPVIIIAKSDLAKDAAQKLSDLYKACGFEVFLLSAKTGMGIDHLKTYIDEHMQNKIAAFAGASGVGKSTLLNRLFPGMGLATGQVSQKTARGRHTTRHVQLFSLQGEGADGSGGYLADTPGFSMLDFVRFDFYDKEALPQTFREFAPYLYDCRYTGCTHTVEQGCAVRRAVASGQIPPSRHESFLQIYRDIKDKRPWNSK